tara:strand:+ start:5074 stop:5469 length:396 start_codon:yes stop_codon:yes gene_type:complete
MQGERMSLAETIKMLELSLLDVDLPVEQKAELIDPEFEEIAPNGQVASKKDVMEWIASQSGNTSARWEFRQFEWQCLQDDMVIISYAAYKYDEQCKFSGFHYSVWRGTDGGAWRLFRHRGLRQEKASEYPK